MWTRCGCHDWQVKMQVCRDIYRTLMLYDLVSFLFNIEHGIKFKMELLANLTKTYAFKLFQKVLYVFGFIKISTRTEPRPLILWNKWSSHNYWLWFKIPFFKEHISIFSSIIETKDYPICIACNIKIFQQSKTDTSFLQSHYLSFLTNVPFKHS